MKPICTLLLLLLLLGVKSYACSTFLLSKNGRHVFGRNYDWVSGNGMMMVNARGLFKTSAMPNDSPAISWVSAYGSISFNQFGKEFPHGGMNEKGLVVELMWLSETSYPAADNRAAMNELQWIQYQLDNCATIDEVIASDKKIRISRDQAAPLHYLVADASGQAATIEFIDGKMKVHRGKELPFPVLTNTVYAEAQQQVKKANGTHPDNSVERFATACKMIGQYQTGEKGDPVDYAFNILDRIAQKGYTRWSIVYDITNGQVYCTTDQSPQRKLLALRDLDFNCSTTSLAIHLNAPQSGQVLKLLAPLTAAQNKALIERSARESSSHIQVSKASIAQAAQYMQLVKCRK